MTWIFFPLIFTAASTTMALLLCEGFGQLTAAIAIFSLLMGLGIAFFLTRREEFKSFNLMKQKISVCAWGMILIYVIFCYRHFLWLVYPKGDGVFVLDVNNFGDLPLHLAYVNYIANGIHFWPGNPNLAGEIFTYPFGFDFFTALFAKLGLSLLTLFPVMGLLFGLLLGATLFLWGGAFTLGGFLFAGGGAGYVYFFSHILKDYQQDLAWKNLMLSMVLTQRGLLYALPAGLLLLWSWRRRFFSASEKPLSPLAEGFLWGTLPLFHIHTFIFLSFIFAVWTVGTRSWRAAIKTLAWAIAPGTFEVLLVTHFFKQASVIWWKPGWMIAQENPLFFFWNNYGLFFPLVFLAVFLFRKDQKARWQFLPALFFFILCLFVMFAPWEWDNNKLMVWCYLLMLPGIERFALRPLPQIPRQLIVALLFFSGFIAAVASHGSRNGGFEIYKQAAVDGTCEALKNARPEDRVATAQIHNHPAYLCGHPLVAGYAGTLWSQGSHAAPTEERLKRLMRGDSDWRSLAHELGVRYIFWGPGEVSQYSPSTRPWETGTVKLVNATWGQIFDLGETP